MYYARVYPNVARALTCDCSAVWLCNGSRDDPVATMYYCVPTVADLWLKALVPDLGLPRKSVT